MKSYFAWLIPTLDGGYLVNFPDFAAATTYGADLDDALIMGQDILDISAKEQTVLPVASTYGQVASLMQKRISEMGADLDKSRPPLVQAFMPQTARHNLAAPIVAPEPVLEIIDAKAQACGMQRSEFIKAAALAYKPQDCLE